MDDRRRAGRGYGGGRRRGYGRGRRRVFQGHDFEGATKNTDFMEGMQEETDRRRAFDNYNGMLEDGRRRVRGYGGSYGRGYGRRLDGDSSEEDRRRAFDNRYNGLVGDGRRRAGRGYGGGRRRGYGYSRGYGYGRGYGGYR